MTTNSEARKRMEERAAELPPFDTCANCGGDVSLFTTTHGWFHRIGGVHCPDGVDVRDADQAVIPRLVNQFHLHRWFAMERTCHGLRIRRCLRCGAVQSRQRGAWNTLSLPFPNES